MTDNLFSFHFSQRWISIIYKFEKHIHTFNRLNGVLQFLIIAPEVRWSTTKPWLLIILMSNFQTFLPETVIIIVSQPWFIAIERRVSSYHYYLTATAIEIYWLIHFVTLVSSDLCPLSEVPSCTTNRLCFFSQTVTALFFFFFFFHRSLE